MRGGSFLNWIINWGQTLISDYSVVLYYRYDKELLIKV